MVISFISFISWLQDFELPDPTCNCPQKASHTGLICRSLSRRSAPRYSLDAGHPRKGGKLTATWRDSLPNRTLGDKFTSMNCTFSQTFSMMQHDAACNDLRNLEKAGVFQSWQRFANDFRYSSKALSAMPLATAVLKDMAIMEHKSRIPDLNS